MIELHGVVLAVEGPELVVVAATATAGIERLIGARLGDAIGGPGEKAVRDAIAEGLAPGTPLEFVIDGSRYDAALWRVRGAIAVGIERAGSSGAERRVLRVADRLHGLDAIADQTALVASELRALTGYDRVTVYRWHATTVEVLADVSGSGEMPVRPHPFHELATDMPGRYLADPAAEPVAIVGDAAVLAPAPIPPGLRGGAFALAIVVGGAPWGVVACEHDGPLALPIAVRCACAALVRQLAWQLELRDRLGREIRASHTAKDEFLATVSHELRTPLNAMLGWLRLIESGQVAVERQPQAIATVTRNAHALAGLVEELLDVSRIVAGKMRLDVQPISPLGVIEAALATIQPAADAKAIRIATALDSDAGPVLADANRLQQIVVNLLTNAVKFTPEHGRIEVRLARAGTGVELTVDDDGAGIEPEFVPHVFDPFRQSAATIGRTKGLGLGLAIVRHLVELHGGQVFAASGGLGKGATFTVRLPAAAPRAASPSPPAALAFEPAPQLRGIRVLTVDDERDANDLLHAMLSASGVEVTSASSAREVLELLPRVRPDVLISDIGMPDVDGYELIQQVRRLAPADGGHVPAIALTAYARSQDRSRGFLAGFDIYLAKPIDPTELTAVLVNLTGRRTGPIPEPPEPTVRGELAGARILVVDDDEDSGELLGDVLRRRGAVVEVAQTAAAGTAAVRTFRPDILVSDLVLPDKDGFTFIRELRALGPDDGGWIPAIAISGRVAPDDVKQAILAGFQLHVAKPVDPQDLVARLARLVARTSRRT